MGLIERFRRVLGRGGDARDSAHRPVAVELGPRLDAGGYLAAVLIFKDEGRFLREWIEFHRLVGVEHFYLYDNGSTDEPRTFLLPLLAEGLVTLVPWSFPFFLGGLTTAQNLAYAHALSTFGAGWRWMAFIDADEFLFPTQVDDLRQVLRTFEDLPALLAFWTMFGRSEREGNGKELVIERFTMRAPFEFRPKPKTIVNPEEVLGVGNCHLFDLRSGPKRGYTETRELYAKVQGEQDVGKPVSSSLQLNHYFTRSEADFSEKLAKWEGRAAKRLELAASIDKNTFHDESILRFVPPLRERLRNSDGV
jgi:hypothetical protein